MFLPHMLRKFPHQTAFANPKNLFNNQMFMNSMFPPHMHPQLNFSKMGHYQRPMMNMNQIDPSQMNHADKRDYYGDQLYTKISSNVNFQQFEE